jgi:DNA-binding NtrC family response regulator
MQTSDKIRGKRVLVVDDEPDVLETLSEILEACKLDTASSFEAARGLIENNDYDMIILDIMGVRGFDLLEMANRHGIAALMLTANAMTEESLRESAEKNACYFIPKEKMGEMETFLADALDAVENGKNPWVRCFQRLGSFYDRKFGGKDWREKEKQFWEKRVKNLL